MDDAFQPFQPTFPALHVYRFALLKCLRVPTLFVLRADSRPPPASATQTSGAERVG